MSREAVCLWLLIAAGCVETPPPESPAPAGPPAPAEPQATTDDPDRSTKTAPSADCRIFEAANPAGNCSRRISRDPQIAFDDEALAADADTEAAVEQLAGVLAGVDGVVELGVGVRAKGSVGVNLRTSQARAETLVAALEAHGVPHDRMVAVGYGDERPVITNEGCDLSERVDVRRLDGPCAR